MHLPVQFLFFTLKWMFYQCIATFFFFSREGMVDLCWLNHVVLRLAVLEMHGGLSYPGGNGYQMF